MLKTAEIFADFNWNCRGPIPRAEVIILIQEIERDGLLQPIIVVPYTEGKWKWKLIAGFRRFTAITALKWEEVECKIIKGLNENQCRLINLKENVDRKDLNIKQEANGIKPFKLAGWPQDEVARQLGQSKGWVQVRFALLELEDDFQTLAAAGLLTQEHIKHLYSLPKGEQRYAAVRAIKEAKVRGEKFEVKNLKKKALLPTRRKNRTPAEIFPWIEHIMDMVGPCFATRCMAWCAGEISDMDLILEIKAAAEAVGKKYVPPEGYKSLRLQDYA